MPGLRTPDMQGGHKPPTHHILDAIGGLLAHGLTKAEVYIEDHGEQLVRTGVKAAELASREALRRVGGVIGRLRRSRPE